MKLPISFAVVLIISLQMNFTATRLAEENTTLFFKKFLKLFADVVQELKTKISVLKEEVRIRKANGSELAIKVNNIQSQVSDNTRVLEDVKTRRTNFHAMIEKLQVNVSENSLNIQNLEIINSETDNKIRNLTIAVSKNTMAVSSPHSNSSASANQTGTPKTCLEVQTQSNNSKSGVYQIFPTLGQIGGIEVYCDLETNGGGWTVFQSRSDKGPRRVDFYRGWEDYEKGFGTAGNEFWIGLKNLATLTASGDQELRIEMSDWDNKYRVANYSEFRVLNETEKYELQIGKYSGDAGDSLKDYDRSPFTTNDQDNDKFSTNCAHLYRGAWWYGSGCGLSNLNGDPAQGHTSKGIWWYHWRGHEYSLRTVQMKFRTRNIL